MNYFVITQQKYICKSIKSKITQLRISAHCLNIERGRYSKPKIPREERFCKFCTEVPMYKIGFVRDTGGFTTTMKTRFMFALNVGQFCCVCFAMAPMLFVIERNLKKMLWITLH